MHVVMWDTGGDEKFRAMANNYYKDSKAVLLVYAINEKDTFNSLDYWVEELGQYLDSEQMILAIAGNKCDMSE